MAESFVDIDGVPESELPAHTSDGRSGDRVSFLEGGLLHVEGGRATFVRWRDVLTVVDHAGSVFVLVPRRPPAQPWIEVTPEMLGGQTLASFVARLEERGAGGGGYRDAVRTRRQNLSTNELRDRIMARDAVPGALEVPSTIMLGVEYPGLSFAQGAVFMTLATIGFVAMEALAMAIPMGGGDPDLVPLATLSGYFIFVICILLGGSLAITLGKRWKAAKNKTLPRQRVLVLAPDGCIVGFSSGVRTLAWSEVGRFAQGFEVLVVKDADGRTIGEMDAGWIDAPLSLVVRVAEAYREAARD